VYLTVKKMAIDWQSMFVPTESILEVLIRGTIMYIGMFALLRIFRRQAGAVGIADLLVVVVIADAAQNGMAGESKSITEAMILIGVIVLWDYVFDLMGYRSPFFARILAPKALLLIKDGELQYDHLKKEFITEEELRSQLRQQGIEDVSDVKECYLESNGHFSVLKRFPRQQNQSNESSVPAVN